MFFNRIKRGLLNIVKPIEDASVVLMTETSAWRNEVINEKAQERKAQRTKKIILLWNERDGWYARRVI